MLAFRVGGSTFPLDFSESAKRVQLGSDLFLFNKLNRNGGIDEPSDSDAFSRLGAGRLLLNWQITSGEPTFAARYGIFFPDPPPPPPEHLGRQGDARLFLFLNITYSF